MSSGPDLPAVTQRTVCELSCRLVNVPADGDGDILGYPLIKLAAPSHVTESTLHPNQEQLSLPVYRPGVHYSQLPTTLFKTFLSRVAPGLSFSNSQLSKVLLAPYHLIHRWLIGDSMEVLLSRFLSHSPSFLPPTPHSSKYPLAHSVSPMAWHPQKACFAAALLPPSHPPSSASLPSASASAPPTFQSALPQETHLHAGAVVHVFDLTQYESSLRPGISYKNGTAAVQAITAPTHTLQHELQPVVAAISWQPCSGSMVAVGTKGGVMLWCISGSSRPPLVMRSVAGKSPWATFLTSGSRASTSIFSSLAWSPDGRMLAAASPDRPGITIWIVATGEHHQVGIGLAAFKMLTWSPCGSYLFAAGVGLKFHLLETNGWTSATWQTPPGAGSVSHASWGPVPSLSERGSGPQQRVLLLSFASSHERASHLVALHLIQEPPSLVAQLMPVTLQDIHLRTPEAQSTSTQQPSSSSERSSSQLQPGRGRGTAGISRQGPLGNRAPSFCGMARWDWDAKGERLAVLLKDPHPAAGCLAIYATGVDPVVTARLLGYARPPPATKPHLSHIDGGLVTMHSCSSRGTVVTARFAEEGLCYNLPLTVA